MLGYQLDLREIREGDVIEPHAEFVRRVVAVECHLATADHVDVTQQDAGELREQFPSRP